MTKGAVDQIRALRERKFAKTKTPTAPTPSALAPPAKPAQPKEADMAPKTARKLNPTQKKAVGSTLRMLGELTAGKPNARKRPAKGQKRPAKRAAKKPDKAKIDIVAGLLTRAKGTTTAEIKDATGWKAVNVPRMAEQAGLKLTQAKEPGKPTRYFGTRD